MRRCEGLGVRATGQPPHEGKIRRKEKAYPSPSTLHTEEESSGGLS